VFFGLEGVNETLAGTCRDKDQVQVSCVVPETESGNKADKAGIAKDNSKSRTSEVPKSGAVTARTAGWGVQKPASL